MHVLQSATFQKGGIHPPGNKRLASGSAIERMPLPPELHVSMAQHFGVPATPTVKAKQAVAEGEVIGVVEKGLGAPVHAPAAGTVKRLSHVQDPFRGKVPCVIIEPDPEAAEPVYEALEWEGLEPSAIVARIREAGVAGMGGAGFPTAIKLSPPPDAPVDTFIVNGAECESYLCADHRLMLERPGRLVTGVRIAMRALGVSRAVIGIEQNKPDAIEAVAQAVGRADKASGATGIAVLPLTVRYPQGSEKQLIEAATGRRVPSGSLPAHVGCVVQNAGSVFAIYEAVALSRNCYERVLTVSGLGIARQANLACRIGTRASDIAEYLGGMTDETVKFVLGGPMMGIALASLDYSVTKTTSGFLFLTASECDLTDYSPCIRCGRCLGVCPMGVSPNEISIHAERNMWAGTLKYNIWDCFECGCCAYVCPAKRPLVQFIRAAKAQLRARG